MKKKIFSILFIAMFMVLIFSIKVNASTYLVSTDKEVEAGNGNVTITITSKTLLGAYNLELVDEAGLKLVSTNPGPKAEAHGKKISGSSTSGVTELGSYTFEVPNVSTNTTYKIVFKATGLADPQGNELGEDNNNAILTVKAPKAEETPNNNTNDNTNDNNSNTSNNNTSSNSGNSNNNTSNNNTTKSSEARLRDLGITPNDFTGFNGDKYEWNCEVPNEVEKVYIYAVPAKGSKVKSGDGNVKLKEGENKFEIVVVAEDGKTKKTYTLNITRKASEQTATPVEEPVVNEEPKTESTTTSTAEETSSTTISENTQNTRSTTSTTKTENTSTKNENQQIVGKVDWLKPETWGQEQYILVAILVFLILTIIVSIILKIKIKKDEEEVIEFPGAEELDRAMFEHQELSDNGNVDDNYYNEDMNDDNPYSTNFNDDYYNDTQSVDEQINNQPVEVEYKEENTPNDNNVIEKNDDDIERKRMLEEYFANQDGRDTKVKKAKTRGKHF